MNVQLVILKRCSPRLVPHCVDVVQFHSIVEEEMHRSYNVFTFMTELNEMNQRIAQIFHDAGARHAALVQRSFGIGIVALTLLHWHLGIDIWAFDIVALILLH